MVDKLLIFTLSTVLPSPVSQPHPQLCWRTSPSDTLPHYPHLQWIAQIFFLIKLLLPTYCFITDQIKQAFSGSPQATLSSETGKLIADLLLSIHTSKFKPLIFIRPLCRPSAVALPYSLSYFQSTNQILMKLMFFFLLFWHPQNTLVQSHS